MKMTKMNRPSLIEFETLYGDMSYRAMREYFEAMNQYADELEKEVKKDTDAIKREKEMWNSFVECNGALNVACKALADNCIPVRKGTTIFCSSKSEEYYRFLLEGTKE